MNEKLIIHSDFNFWEYQIASLQYKLPEQLMYLLKEKAVSEVDGKAKKLKWMEPLFCF